MHAEPGNVPHDAFGIQGAPTMQNKERGAARAALQLLVGWASGHAKGDLMFLRDKEDLLHVVGATLELYFGQEVTELEGKYYGEYKFIKFKLGKKLKEG